MSDVHPTMTRLFEKTGKSPTELANLLNESPQNINNWCKRGISKKGALLVNNVLGYDLDWILTGNGVAEQSKDNNFEQNVAMPNKFRMAPVLNTVQAGKFNGVFDDCYDDFLPVYGDSGLRSYWLVIKGNSMTPDFLEGEYILVDPDLCPQPSDFVVALKRGENEVTFKKYRPRGYDDNGVEYCQLIPSNADYPVIDSRFEPFDVCAVLVEHRKRYR